MNLRITPRERVLGALCVLLLAAFFFGGQSLPELKAKESVSDSDVFEELNVFTDVLTIVRREYVSDVNLHELIKGAIKGMLATLDPHSGYLDPDFYQDLKVQTTGEFGGLGIEITIRDGLLVVVAPMEGSPAAKAGVLPGDIIIKIDGKFTKEFSLIDAVQRLRGPKGSPITVSISRKGIKRLLDFTIVRDKIVVNSVKNRYLGEGYGYVRISQFMERTGVDVKNSLDKMRKQAKKEGFKGMILDLRNNPGGLLDQAVYVGDLFLKDGVIVYTEGRDQKQEQKYFARERGTEPDYPMIVLVNGGSASAAEIVAGALKDHGRALVLGTQTFGKGSVQTITPLRNGGALSLTTALYYTKSGNSIQAKGVTPDIDLPMETPVLLKTGAKKNNKDRLRESDLPGAIKNPSDNGGEPPLNKLNKVEPENEDLTRINPETSNIEDWLKNDLQVSRALEYLKTWDIFKKGVPPS